MYVSNVKKFEKASLEVATTTLACVNLK